MSASRFVTSIAQRMVARYGMPLGPAEMKLFGKADHNLPPPVARQRWQNSFEPPGFDEGLAAIDSLPFVRGDPAEFTAKDLLLDVDGTLTTTKSGDVFPRHLDDVELLPGRSEVLQEWVAAGYRLFFGGNGIFPDRWPGFQSRQRRIGAIGWTPIGSHGRCGPATFSRSAMSLCP